MLHQARRTVHSIGNHLRRAMHGFDLRRAINTGIETGVNAARAIDGGFRLDPAVFGLVASVLDQNTPSR